MPTFLEHAETGRHSFWRYLVTILLMIVAQTVAVVALIAVLMAGGANWTTLQTDLMDPAKPFVFFGMIGISFAAMLLATVGCVAWLHKKRPSALVGNWSWGLFATGVGVWLVVLIVNTAIGYALRPEGFVFEMKPAALGVALVVLIALGVQTFAEEYIFRGYITQAFLKLTRRTWVTCLISGVIFGAVHIPNGIPQAVSATMMGIAFAWISIKTGNIAFAWGAHLINNLFGALVVVSGVDVFKGSPALIRQTTPDLMWFDVGFVALALIAIMLVLARRKTATVTTPSHA